MIEWLNLSFFSPRNSQNLVLRFSNNNSLHGYNILHSLFFFFHGLTSFAHFVQKWIFSRKIGSWNLGFSGKLNNLSKQAFRRQSFECATVECHFFAGWWVPHFFAFNLVELYWHSSFCSCQKASLYSIVLTLVFSELA